MSFFHTGGMQSLVQFEPKGQLISKCPIGVIVRISALASRKRSDQKKCQIK